MGDLIKLPTYREPPARPAYTGHQPRRCFACGKDNDTARGRYCRSCTSKGEDTPIIDCKIPECEVTGKRRWPGQTHFYCPEHRHLAPGYNAPTQEKLL